MRNPMTVRSCVVGLLGVCVIALPMRGQACHGTPRGGAIAFEHAELSIGKSEGGSIAVAGNHAAIAGTYRYRKVAPDRNGHEGATRLSLVLGMSNLVLCPTLGLDYQRDTWTIDQSSSVLSNRLAGRGGLNAGLDIPLGKSFLITPFAGGQYEFAVLEFDPSGSGGNSNIMGDTLSHVDLEFGAIAQFKSLYGGFSVNRHTDFGRPYMARFVVGFALGSKRR